MSSGKAFIGKPAPDFSATAVMPDGQFKDIKLSDYRGNFMCSLITQIARTGGYLRIDLGLVLQ